MPGASWARRPASLPEVPHARVARGSANKHAAGRAGEGGGREGRGRSRAEGRRRKGALVCRGGGWPWVGGSSSCWTLERCPCSPCAAEQAHKLGQAYTPAPESEGLGDLATEVQNCRQLLDGREALPTAGWRFACLQVRLSNATLRVGVGELTCNKRQQNAEPLHCSSCPERRQRWRRARRTSAASCIRHPPHLPTSAGTLHSPV